MRPPRSYLLLHSAHEVNGVWGLDALLLEPAKRLDQHDAAHPVVQSLPDVAARRECGKGTSRSNRVARPNPQGVRLFFRFGAYIQKNVLAWCHAAALFG